MIKLTRRQFTALLSAGGLAALLPETAAAATGDAAGIAGGAAAYRKILTAHQSGHHLLIPAAHITALTATLRDMAAEREDAPLPGRRELRQAQAEYAEHLSWLHREAGHLDACWTWADRATRWALEAGDTTMAAYLQLRRASVALDQHQPARAAELAAAVQNPAWSIPPALHAAAHLYQARAEAMTGTISGGHLERADTLLAARPGATATPHPYLRFYTPEFGSMQRATCYMAAGAPSRALTIFHAHLTQLPATHHRDRAVDLARIGAAHAASGEPDEAASAGLSSLTEARQAGSSHTLSDLLHLDTTLTRSWPRRPNVRELHDALDAYRNATNTLPAA